MNVSLRDITKENWTSVARLSLSDSQSEFLFDNSYSIAESFFCENSVTRAVYAGEDVVGFIMYESLDDDGKPDEVEFLRFMISEKFQDKGIGKLAFEAAIEDIKSVKKPGKIYIFFHIENDIARRLYEQFGFIDNGIDEHGQASYLLKVE